MFTHLHTYSSYSFLVGLASPAGLAQAAARHGMPALALTDRQVLTGAVEFSDACREAGVRPLLGLELDVAAPPGSQPGSGSLLLLAMDLDGWSSLCRLSSALLTGQAALGSTILPFEALAQEARGLLCLSGGRRGLVDRLLAAGRTRQAADCLQQLSAIFPDCLYVEIDLKEPADERRAAASIALVQAAGLPTVASSPVYYLAAEQTPLARLAVAIRLNRRLDDQRGDLPDEALPPPNSHFAASGEMAARFAAFPLALAATQEVAERCRLELPLGRPNFPQVSLPPGQDALSALRLRAEAGARHLYSQITPEIQARLDYELTAIGERGYAPLFLVMEAVIDFTRQRGIPVSSRGSAASSLVAHCLGITAPDPLRLNLYFERFLNPARATPPDIDTDLCSRRRDEVIEFVYEHFGREKVAMVCTISRFRRRSALREAAKAYGLSATQITELVDQIPRWWWRPRALANQEAESPFAGLEARYPQHRDLFKQAAQLVGLPRHLSIHPGGMVIAPGPLTDLVPTLLAPKGVAITQFDLESIERFGLVKIDLLGIRGLTVLGDVGEAVRQRQPECFATSLEALDAIPLDDPAVAELLRAGRTIGCFQIESPGMRATLKEIQADSVDDLMVALALYRPGPLTGGLKGAFVRRHKGEQPADYLHPALEPLLADTYGVILYQEQVLRIAHELAGLSLSDADLLRRAMSHFDPGEQMRTLQERFVAGAHARSGVPLEVGERVWQLMAAFAGYGFPKAHAASYALVSWRSAWCKTHEPAVFLAAVLANWGGYYSQRVYLTEARRLGLAVRPPDVNHARREFSVAYLDGNPTLFMGLDQVRDLTRRTQTRIMKARPFHSLADFLARADPRPLEAENLIQSGALENLGTIPQLLHQLKSQGGRSGQLPLFSLDGAGGEEVDWSLQQKLAAQQAILGAWVTAHPLDLVTEQIQAAGALSTMEAAARLGQRVRVAGVRQTWQRARAARGEPIYWMALEDLEGMLQVEISAGVFRRYRAVFAGGEPMVVEGEVDLDETIGEPFIRAIQAWKLE